MKLDGLVRRDLAARTRFNDIRLLDTTPSTNRLLAELAATGSPEGVVVVAEFQTAGRGRLDRSWEARPGDGLLVSVLLRPDLPMERWHLVTAAAALAARSACQKAAAVTPEVKWPNDLLAGEQKLAGILAEAVDRAAVVGMGLNVHGGPPGSAVLDDLAGRRIDRARLLAEWLSALDGRLRDWDGVAADFRAQCATLGRDVSVQLASGATVTGRAESLDDQGRLVVRRGDGSVETVGAGDVTHLR